MKATFEHSLSWLEDASTSVGQTTTGATQFALRGRVENPDEIGYPDLGSRFIPDSVGLALVRSETADVYALRLKQNQRLVSFQMRPNPDIPPDRNIITFPMNPRYVKQGTFDGKVGLKPDVDYPNALTYSSDSSYFKPIEAYALKNRISRARTQLQPTFDDARPCGGPRRAGPDFRQRARTRCTATATQARYRQSYVSTADSSLTRKPGNNRFAGGTLGGAYAFKGLGGITFPGPCHRQGPRAKT